MGQFWEELFSYQVLTADAIICEHLCFRKIETSRVLPVPGYRVRLEGCSFTDKGLAWISLSPPSAHTEHCPDRTPMSQSSTLPHQAIRCPIAPSPPQALG